MGLQTLPSSHDLSQDQYPEKINNVLGMSDICSSEGVISRNNPVPSCLRSELLEMAPTTSWSKLLA